MSDFSVFSKAVSKQLEKMEKLGLYTVDLDKDVLWNLYQDSYPEGYNKIYKTNREHDCNCCKQFIRNCGNIVAFEEGELVTIWDIEVPHPYNLVAEALSKYVKEFNTSNVFLTGFKKIGAESTKQITESGTVINWNHFYHNFSNEYVVQEDKIPATLGTIREDKQVLERSLKEISQESVDIVLDLISQNSLYKGEEFKAILQTLSTLKKNFAKLETVEAQQGFLWDTAKQLKGAGRFRNTVIGTLLIDISEGVDLEVAVKKYEDKTAPSNYKRPTALITQGMIKKAEETIVELGLQNALQRRVANINDITINNVLFADRSAKKSMGVLQDIIKPTAKSTPKFDKVEEVSIERFINDILPTATSVEAFIQNEHKANLVTLVAPVDKDAGNMLKWKNNFSWSYNGEVTDSMKERVSAAGGRVDGVFRFTHSWNELEPNQSLMDLHVFLPGNSNDRSTTCHDNYGSLERVGWNNRKHLKSGGVQDVDYTDQAPEGYIPIENITFPTLSKMPEGDYVCKIHNWSYRNSAGRGKAELECGGKLYQYEYPRTKHKEWVTIATVTLKNGVFTVNSDLPSNTTSQKVWNITTEEFQPVSVIMNSPNHWDGECTGNKHYFFMIKGCKTDESVRGFYNEFLSNELTPHRKVFEVLSAKMKAEPSDDQLSGIGFSSTKRASLICKVSGSFNRTVKVVF